MSITDINNAAAAQNGVTARMNAFLDNIDADIATKQAAYAALAGNLKGVVATSMNFVAYVNPGQANPTNVNGGTFTTIAAAVNAAPFGASVTAHLAAGGTHFVPDSIDLRNRRVKLVKHGAGDAPVVYHTCGFTGVHNAIYGFQSLNGGSLRAEGIAFFMEDKVNAGAPWSNTSCVMEYATGGNITAELSGCTVTGHTGQRFTAVLTGGQVRLALRSTTFDGPIYAVGSCSGGLTFISQSAPTLLNGAQLADGGTLGTNLFLN